MIGNILAFVFGSIVGSFLNVCVYRMPMGKSVVWPGSHCPRCEKRIPWYDNIPFISFILLGGRCRYCKKGISFRYFIIELLTAVIFVLFFNRYRLSYDLFLYLVLACSLITAAFIDIKHRIIPDEISIGGIIVGFILSAIKGLNIGPFSFNFNHAFNSLLGIAAGGGIIYLTGFLFDLVYFKLLKKPAIEGETSSMGGGDVKLLAMIGAFLGPQNAVLTFFLAPFLGSIIGIINLAVRKKHVIPYGPFLSLAALITIFWADKIISLIFWRW